LEKYFFTDSLLANNLRFELTGSEVAHPDKAKINFSGEVAAIGITPAIHPEYFKYNETGEVLTTKGLDGSRVPEVIDNFKDLIWLKSQPDLKGIYDNAILKIEAVGQGT
jgi:hypothetical protein